MAGATGYAVLRQELKDFKDEMISRLGRIERQTTMTNGKVASALTDIALLKDNQNDCPARKYHIAPTKMQVKDYIMGVIAIVVAIIAVVT